MINYSLISNASVCLKYALWINNYGEIEIWLHKTHKQANWLKEVTPVWDHFLAGRSLGLWLKECSLNHRLIIIANNLCARVPCSVSCDLGCPCGRGPRPSLVPSTLGSEGSAPAHHSCLRASAWPHCIPGAAWPFPATALGGPRAPPSAQDRVAPPPLQDCPSKAINRALSQKKKKYCQ